MSRSSLTAALLVALCLSALVCRSSAVSCPISEQWSTLVPNVTSSIVPAILPAPHCLLVSDAMGSPGSPGSPFYGYYYALDVRSGSLLWQWPTEHAPLTIAQQLGRSAHAERVYALLRAFGYPDPRNGTATATLAALHGNGTLLWQRDMNAGCQGYVVTSFAIMQPPVLYPALGERIVLAAGCDSGGGEAVALDGSTGRLLSTFTVEQSWADSLTTVGDGREGYFTTQPLGSPYDLRLYRLLPDGTVVNVTQDQSQLLALAQLFDQPAVRHENKSSSSGSVERLVVARDVASGKPWWSSNDSFLVGTDWGTQGTFEHTWTHFYPLDDMPDLFLVVNTAYDTAQDDHNNTIVAQAGVYRLSSGVQLSLSPVVVYTGEYLTWPWPQPRQYGDVVVLDMVTGWYALQLPALALIGQAPWPLSPLEQWTANWLVDVDGSYIAIDYRGSNVTGSPPVNQSEPVARRRLKQNAQHRHVRFD